MSDSNAAAALQSALASLVSDHVASRECWTVYRNFLASSISEFCSSMEQHTPEIDLVTALATMLIPVARLGFKEGRRSDLFKAAENMGIHMMPVHFYSPVPATQTIPETVWSHVIQARLGCDFNIERQLRVLQRLGRWGAELSDTPVLAAPAGEFCWNNPAFCPGDAAVYYSMIREYHPRQVVEVGSGYSTMLAARACLKNGDTQLRCIEPYPMEALATVKGVTEVISSRVQDIPLEWFDRLDANDVLFIDSTHVSKIGSDVNYLVLEVLPRLKSGVLVHFHDIFLPNEMPRNWVMDYQLFWNEQYLLAAFLLFNNAFEVICANQLLGTQYPDEFRAAFPVVTTPGGASFWMRRQ
jgi:hypothetical protein